MKKTLILISAVTILNGLCQLALAQESVDKNETWYVWIDTEVPVENKMVKVVSNEPMVITCCPKSAKYRKFVKKTAKWITENVAADYKGELSLMKIQDKELADKAIANLKETEGVWIVDYVAACK